MTDQDTPEPDDPRRVTQISVTLGDLHEMLCYCVERTHELTKQNVELDDIVSQVAREVAENMRPVGAIYEQ